MSTRRKKAAIALAVAAPLALLLLVGRFLHQADLQMTGRAPVPCAEAVRFLHAEGLPAGAREKRCTGGQWQTTWYTVEFRSPRARAEAWLRSSYPGAEVRHGCADADVCSDPRVTGDGGHDLADHVSVEIGPEEDGLARVRLTGGTTT
ncbi:hypothetical protein QEZ40_003447 [Streptomyces katrae]|uniref:Secreted protein n=1 Tax=Streptomyces katrae TaxID=68223 RepID=A0ABT7GMK7_9ACTN|nr:hypothetical protein [Streptomyces katrae]MDK9494813.1 hypothetical protein [Streptomyces katrae]